MNNRFALNVFLLSAVKLSLILGQVRHVKGHWIHDDRLFINLAKNILSGQWLGDFNQFTMFFQTINNHLTGKVGAAEERVGDVEHGAIRCLWHGIRSAEHLIVEGVQIVIGRSRRRGVTDVGRNQARLRRTRRTC